MSPQIVANSKFGPIICNVNDQFITRSIINTGYFSEAEIKLIAQLIKVKCADEREFVFYDVGSNIGTHSLAIARMFGQRVHVRAFEAQRNVYNMLCGTIALNNLSSQVRCHHNAVSHTTGDTLEIRLPDYSKVNNFGGFEVMPPKRSDNQNMSRSGLVDHVPTVTIDSFNEAVDILKMDIEGMEHLAIQGAQKTIERSRPVCCIEILKTDTDVVYSFFKTREYNGFVHGKDAYFLPRELQVSLQNMKKMF